jgi:hypothetical protein
MAYQKRSSQPHPLFRAVFDDWQARAGVRSGEPDAPIVPDDPRPRWQVWRWLRNRLTSPPRRDHPAAQQPVAVELRRRPTDRGPLVVERRHGLAGRGDHRDDRDPFVNLESPETANR